MLFPTRQCPIDVPKKGKGDCMRDEYDRKLPGGSGHRHLRSKITCSRPKDIVRRLRLKNVLGAKPQRTLKLPTKPSANDFHPGDSN